MSVYGILGLDCAQTDSGRCSPDWSSLVLMMPVVVPATARSGPSGNIWRIA